MKNRIFERQQTSGFGLRYSFFLQKNTRFSIKFYNFSEPMRFQFVDHRSNSFCRKFWGPMSCSFDLAAENWWSGLGRPVDPPPVGGQQKNGMGLNSSRQLKPYLSDNKWCPQVPNQKIDNTTTSSFIHIPQTTNVSQIIQPTAIPASSLEEVNLLTIMSVGLNEGEPRNKMLVLNWQIGLLFHFQWLRQYCRFVCA